MPFVKGQSGNPGGRPNVVGEVQQLARQHTTAALQTLVSVMSDEEAPAAARVAAANAVLDRGYGRPPQAMTVSKSNDLADFSDAELVAIINAANEEGENGPGGLH